MAGKRLVLMPGAYDALSARIMEAEGFEAICAGGYAAIGSMLAQPDMGQSNMRDYADHYARICARRRGAGLCRRRYRLRRRQQCAADGARIRGRGRRRHVHQRSGVSQPLRLSAGQAGDPGRADAGQDQGRARRAARSGFLHRRPHRRRRRRRPQCGDRALPALHGGRRRYGEAAWASIRSRTSSA